MSAEAKDAQQGTAPLAALQIQSPRAHPDGRIGPSRDCLIVDLSEGGVRLHSEINEMPNDFTLLIPDAEHPRRSCRVVWRLGFEIGAKFTDLDRLPARRSSARAVLA